MKNISVLLIMILIGGALLAISMFGLQGCTTAQLPPPADPVCERPEFSQSWICERLQSAGFENAEDAHNILLDANAMALIFDVYTVDQFLSVLYRFEFYLDIPGLSYTVFFEMVLNDLKKAKQASAIIKRRFAVLQSMNIMMVPDRDLIRLSIEGLRKSVQ